MSTNDRYAVVGNPIAHSKSPLLQMAFAKQTGQAITYTTICAPENEFITTANEFFHSGGKGLNVTVPFKQDAYDYAQQLTLRAQRAGAVNTLWCDQQGIIHGDTTDGVGLVTDIQQRLGWLITGKQILIIGAGGAVRGVLEPLLAERPAAITIVNRTVAKAQQLTDVFVDLFPITACGYDQLKGQAYDLIINGTSASLSGDLPPLPEGVVTAQSYCYDMMYSQQLTPFLQWAQQQGANNLSDGLGMLVSQGAESFFIWRGFRPEVLPVIAKMRAAL